MLNKLLHFSLFSLVVGVFVTPAASSNFDLARYSATAEMAYDEIKAARDSVSKQKDLTARRNKAVSEASRLRKKYGKSFISKLLPFASAVKGKTKVAGVKKTINEVRNFYYILAYLDTSYYFRIADKAAQTKSAGDVAALRKAIDGLLLNLETISKWEPVAAGTIVISTFSYYGMLYTLYQRLVTAQHGKFDDSIERRMNTFFLKAVKNSIKGL